MKRLPIGIEDFKELIDKDCYYVDKTSFITDIINEKVALYTRPRRFGKTLNMSMLYYFFSMKQKDNAYLFNDMDIVNHTDSLQYQNQYPVIFITLKDMKKHTFENQKAMFAILIQDIVRKNQELLESEELNTFDKEQLIAYYRRSQSDVDLQNALKFLCGCLKQHYHKDVILLIDEYDVPLQSAYLKGYYDEMADFLSGMFSAALKTNDALEKGILTGCLRIAKESIFTGLNNFSVYSISEDQSSTSFGFTPKETITLLEHYDLKSYEQTIKEWYDGYRFGNVDVYCPWDVINYCSDHIANQECAPKNYWVNTSGNDVIHRFINSIYEPQKLTKLELEHLVNGGSVQKEISQEMTYKELYSSIDNLWSTLFMTGYLTSRSNTDGNRYDLVIPNREIRNIITEHILKLFKENIKQDGQKVNAFCDALLTEKADVAEKLFSDYMQKTISVRDTFVQKPTKENFYHGILLGILGFKENWLVTSNRESGDGFSDIMIQVGDSEVGIVIEVKYANDGNLEAECKKALKQIDDTGYAEALHQDGICKILKYAIACYKKTCKIMLEAEKC